MKKSRRRKRRNPPYLSTLVNPPKRKRAKRRRNSLAIRHVIVDDRKANPHRRRRTRKKFVKKNPPMKTKRHRKRRRHNPHRSRGRVHRRRSHRRRNPHRRYRRFRGFGRRSNPVQIVSQVFSPENISRGAGVLTGVVGTNWLLNTLIQGNATTGARVFDLPGITYSTAGNTLSNAQFQSTNKIALAFYQVAIPAFLGYFLQSKSANFSRGMMEAAIVNAGVAALRGTTIGTTAGLSAFLAPSPGMGRGMRTYIPGVSPMLSGPATAFLNGGSPVARRGMGAVVNPRWHNQTTTKGPNPYAAT